MPKSLDRWYGLNVWKIRRKFQLQREPLCRFCASEGRTMIATVADHIVPHGGEWNAFRLGALQSLCRDCHERTKKLVELRGYDPAMGPDGFPLSAQHPAYSYNPLK
jgi:5-methylcytosine-specific restriction endonuclease McrA